MRTWTITFLLGILAFLQLSEIPSLWLLPVIITISLGCHIFTRYRLYLSGGFLLGFCWAMVRAVVVLDNGLPPEFEGKTLIATGQVISLPEYRDKGIRFEFEIEKLVAGDGKVFPGPDKVRLNWYEGKAEMIPGQIWQLSVRLKRPYGFMNPGGFDYEAWLFQHRIRATGYVVNNASNSYTGLSAGGTINRIRYLLRQGINNNLEGSTYSGLIAGLSIGDRSQISKSANDTLIRTGTNHLLSISGLHISLVAGLFYFLVLKLWSYSGTLPLRIAAPRIAILVAIIAACGYAVLAGLSIPTQRSLIMVTVIMLGIFSHRRYPFSKVFCTALLSVLILDPFATLDAGFWLSFSAIAIIAYGMSCRVDVDNLWWRWGRTQYLVAIGLMPLLLLLFGQYSIAGMVANLVAIPWVSFITTPFALAGTVMASLFEPAGRLFLQLADGSLELLWPFLEWLASMEGAVWQQPAVSIRVMGASIIGTMILLQPAGLPARWVGLIWMLPLFFPLKQQPDNNELWFTLLDVGQGLSAVVHTPNHTLVYDTGARFSENFNAGSAVVVPYLRELGVDNIDTLIISHGDNDHIGGAGEVLKAFPETRVLTSVPEKLDPKYVEYCRAGQAWSRDGVNFQILHPSDTDNFRDNNQSCVLKVTMNGYSILLSGDIEKQAENRLMKKYKDELPANILVAPHHGSKSSSTIGFINTVAPELVLFPVGYRNRFNLPNQDIMRRYAARGVSIYDTARHGAILIKVNQAGISITSYRQMARRFWHTMVN